MSPLLFPAIDLRDGRCVRLLKGEFDRETDYGDDPVGWDRSIEEAGASWLHVVDLDGARTGVPRNREAIQAVVSAVDLPVQVGGGVRTVGDACALFDAGVDRVVMGTAAVECPDLVTEVARRGPVAVGLDVRGIHLAVHGWARDSGLTVAAALERIAPRTGAYEHEKMWHDDNGHSHVRAALIGPSLALPIVDGTLPLGTWQQVVLVDLDTRSRNRQVVVNLVGE